MPAHKYTTEKVIRPIRALAQNGKSGEFLAEHARLLLRMPEEEAAPIWRAVACLANEVPQLGPIQAFEVVVRMSRKLTA